MFPIGTSLIEQTVNVHQATFEAMYEFYSCSLDDEVEDRKMKQQQHIHVSNLGYAAWYFTRTYRVKCDMVRVMANVTDEPGISREEPVLECKLKFASWSYSGWELQVGLLLCLFTHTNQNRGVLLRGISHATTARCLDNEFLTLFILLFLQIYNSTNEVRDMSETQQVWNLYSTSIVNNKPENIWYTLHYPDVTYTLQFRRNINFHNEL